MIDSCTKILIENKICWVGPDALVQKLKEKRNSTAKNVKPRKNLRGNFKTAVSF